MSIAYQQSSYLCIEVLIGPLTIQNYLLSNKHLQQSSITYNKILDHISWSGFDQLFNELFTRYVITKLSTQLPDLITHKLQWKLSAKIEMVVCKEEEQGEFLIQTIRELNRQSQTQASSL